MNSVINLSDVDNEGILFVRHNNLVGYTTCVITDQPFDAAGIYFKDNISGTEKIRYLLVDILTGMKISGLKDYGPTLEDLLNSKDIMKVAVGRVKPVYKNKIIDQAETLKKREEFRVHITNIVSASTQGWGNYVKRLFGCKVTKDGNKYNSVDIVNVIVKLISGELSPNWNSVDVNLEHRNIETITDAYDNMSTVFAQAITSTADEYNVPIQSYIHENDMFDELRYINRTLTDEELTNHFITTIKDDTTFKNLLLTFDSFIRGDDAFLNNLLYGMQFRMDRKLVKVDLYRDNLLSTTEMLVNYLNLLPKGSPTYNKVYSQIHANEMISGTKFL